MLTRSLKLASVLILGVAGANAGIAQTFTTIGRFSASLTANRQIQAPLAIGPGGNLFGIAGGGSGYGFVFKLTPGGNPTSFYAFCPNGSCVEGQQPMSGLLLGHDGNFYGTTSSGGQYGYGEIYELSLTGNVTVLHDFCSAATSTCDDGANPQSGLIEDSAGNFYGTTQSGGANGNGTIYKLPPPEQNFSALYSLCSTCTGLELSGTNPSGLVADSSGAIFYGTLYSGGQNSKGGVFKLDTTANATQLFTLIYSFCSESGSSCSDGAYPSSQPLVFGNDGNLYGTTQQGGFNGYGTVFKLSTGGKIATLYSFCNVANCADGTYAEGLILGRDGNFYGVTDGGGEPGGIYNIGDGTIYKITPTGVLTTLYTFCSSGAQICFDGINPGPLVQAPNGTLYGTTLFGGDSNGDGTAFSLSLHGPARAALGALVDHFGTGGADFTVFRPSTGFFFSLDQADVSTAQHFGTSGDIPVNGDYDGDGKTDLAVFRPSSGDWFILQSSNKLAVVKHFGASGDIPLAGDFDGDGKSDIAVFRPSTGDWYILQSSNNQVVTKNFGIATDIPVVGDFDGDGKTDIAVFRPSTGTWYIIASDTGETITHIFGEAGDIPVPGYYDADAMTDIAVYRPSNGTFFYVQSSNGQSVLKAFGSPGDIPVAQDYDGDGRTDVAVFRPSTSVWYYIQSSTGELVGRPWGTTGDIPLNEAGH